MMAAFHTVVLPHSYMRIALISPRAFLLLLPLMGLSLPGQAQATAEPEAEPAAETAAEAAPAPAATAVEPGDAGAAPAQAVAAPDTAGVTTITAEDFPALELLGEAIAPNSRAQLSWRTESHFSGLATPTPVLVAHGTKPGPVLCLTAAIHGDELNGIEIVRRVMHELDTSKLSGSVIGIPIVNLVGFQRNSRYLPDRRDLNRAFPGRTNGSLAARIAHSLYTQVIQHCSQLVDLHTGSFHRTNLVQLRADLKIPAVLTMTQAFGAITVLQSRGALGTLRRAATDSGIPSVTLEVGEPLRLQTEQVEIGVRGVESLMHNLGMQKTNWRWSTPQPVFYESHWMRANRGGILLTKVELGETVTKGQLLGTVTDPITNERSFINSKINGRVLGMALNQVVMPGFAAFRIGVQTSAQEVSQQPPEVEGPSTQEDLNEEAAEAEEDQGQSADREPQSPQAAPPEIGPAEVDDSD